MKESNDLCHDHFYINKEQSMLADCQRLVERNRSLDQADKFGITFLHIATAKSYLNVVRFLLYHHVNVNQADDTGATALHLCARHEQILIVKLLLNANANPSLCDRFGRKPSEMCISNNLIRTILLKAEDKRKCAEQSDDSLEEGDEQSIDSSSDEDDDQNDLQVLFMPIPQRQQISQLLNNDNDDQSNSMNIRNQNQMSLSNKLPNDDLALLPVISEESLLHNLEIRYRQGQIYTYIGDILIALNPFDYLPIYSRTISELYKNTQSIISLPPHIYGCAERIYRNMLREKTSQCVVISGLSGSEKTESCKYIIHHILNRSSSNKTMLNIKINQIDSLMEAFGNAKTYINHNSSRVGKYLQIHFSSSGNVLGAHLKEYLLEKSRVVSSNKNEANFHIFYYLLASLSHENGLKLLSEHRYIPHNPQMDAAKRDEYRKKFQLVKQSLFSIGFPVDVVRSIFTILSAILLIGDIIFIPHGFNNGVLVENKHTIDKIAELLQLSSFEFSSALVTELQITRDEQVVYKRNSIQASKCRDTFAKALYGRLFSWIVNGINKYLQPSENESNSPYTIAVLDIFGFENFKSNSFEQLCINLSNEHIHQFLNQYIYDLEIQDYQQEGIEPVDITYTNNRLIIDIFLDKHSGILAILDEESRIPQATDQSLTTKLHQRSTVQINAIHSIPKNSATSFTIRHYATPVEYNINDLLEKNRDFLPNSIVSVARTSNNTIIQELFRGLVPSSLHKNQILTDKTNTNDGIDIRTVAYYFQPSLSELLDTMNRCQRHFVCCIKPNEMPDKFSLSIRRQMSYFGLEQMCEIRKKGYSLRIQFDEFLQRYNVLVVCLLPLTVNNRSKELSSYKRRDQAIECLKRAGIDNYKVGQTKLLFHYSHYDLLHNLVLHYEKKVNICQKVVRGWLTRVKYFHLREIHQLQLASVQKFSNEIYLNNRLYKTKMDKQNQYDKKRRLIQNSQEQNDEDDEQVEKTLNFFDSILDQYLSDQDEKKDHRSSNHKVIPINNNGAQQIKHDYNGKTTSNTSHSTPPPYPADIQPQNIRYRSQQMISDAPTYQVRRYTSENDLDQIASSSKPTIIQKSDRPRAVQTTATSREDLTTAPSWKNLSPKARLSALLNNTNHLIANGASASLIDLTAIDKLYPNEGLPSRPLFRFVPPSSKILILKEEPEIKQHSNYHLKTISSNETSVNNKYSHNIVKPIVIIPPKSQTAPITRLKETNIHHQNGPSAFKPHQSSKNNKQSTPVSKMKRTESVQKPGVRVGMTNPNNPSSNAGLLLRQQQSMPQFHQSMLNLSSVGTPEMINTNQVPDGMVGSPRTSIQMVSSRFMKHPAYAQQSHQINRHHQYYPTPPSSSSSSSRPYPNFLENSISRWMQQVNNNNSSMNGLIYPSQQQRLTNGGGNRPQQQQQVYPHSSYVSTSSAFPASMINHDHLHRQQSSSNHINIPKHHSSQNSVPVQSPYVTSPPTSRNGLLPSSTTNIYHFSQNISPRVSSSSKGGQSRHRQNATTTTYL